MVQRVTSPSFADIEKEFDETLGYIRNDISAMCGQSATVNYTVALLVGIGCEFLAEAQGNKKPQEIFAELLPTGDWKVLAKPLFEAVRNGLAHKFDTKHLHVDGCRVQIYFSWTRNEIVDVGAGVGVFIGTRPLGLLLCEKIEEFRQQLEVDITARERFREAYRSQDWTGCTVLETAAWKRLAAGK